jgi:hypothetical protein
MAQAQFVTIYCSKLRNSAHCGISHFCSWINISDLFRNIHSYLVVCFFLLLNVFACIDLTSTCCMSEHYY